MLISNSDLEVIRAKTKQSWHETVVINRPKGQAQRIDTQSATWLKDNPEARDVQHLPSMCET